MIEINCPHCGHQLRIDEQFSGKTGTCKSCKKRITVPSGFEPDPVQPVLSMVAQNSMPPENTAYVTKGNGCIKGLRIGCLAVFLCFVGLVILGSLLPDLLDDYYDDYDSSPRTSKPKRDQDSVEVLQESSGGLTGPVGNAVRSAKSYLRVGGFSRSGLIKQLSSEYGSDYDVVDATAAVDSLNVDWNEQAARSAKAYLSMNGFSCNGLIEQLSSDYGDGYTESQAIYGAKQAGACY